MVRLEEQRQLHLPQKYKSTVPDSTLRVEMNNLEEQADNAKARELFWKPLSWLGAIRPTSANDAFDPALWETFVCTTLGLEVPILTALPRLHNSPLAKCGCKKFCMDFVTAAEWYSPAATAEMGAWAKCCGSTRVGTSLSCPSLRPSRSCAPLPHADSSPASVTASVWSHPQAIVRLCCT